MRPFPGTLSKGKYGRTVVNDEQLAWLREYFPKTENSRICKAMGTSIATMHRIARLHHLTKSAEGFHAIKVRQGRRIARRLNSTGYYASLRGKAPSQAALDGFQRYVHSEAYKHPLKLLKEKHPKKYRALMKAKSEQRKAVITEERKRIRLGLRRKTTIHLPVTNYTTSQLNRRVNALKRGYIIPDRTDYENRWCIWYDDETERSRIFERNLKGDGFKVLPLPGDEDEHLNQYRFN